MKETKLVELIKTTEKVGKGTREDIAHRHIQYYTKDGELVFENCGIEDSEHKD